MKHNRIRVIAWKFTRPVVTRMIRKSLNMHMYFFKVAGLKPEANLDFTVVTSWPSTEVLYKTKGLLYAVIYIRIRSI